MADRWQTEVAELAVCFHISSDLTTKMGLAPCNKYGAAGYDVINNQSIISDAATGENSGSVIQDI